MGKSRVVFVVALVSILIALVVFFGLRVGFTQYLISVVEIRLLSEPVGLQAATSFYGDSTEYAGILAGVDTRGDGKIWIWRDFRLEYFPVGKDTIYSFWHVCDDQTRLAGVGTGAPVARDVDSGILAWSRRVKPGAFVQLLYPSSNDTSYPGILKLVYSYDWKPYLPTDINKQCKNLY